MENKMNRVFFSILQLFLLFPAIIFELSPLEKCVTSGLGDFNSDIPPRLKTQCLRHILWLLSSYIFPFTLQAPAYLCRQ